MEEFVKIAVCLVGQVRTSTLTWWNIKQYLGKYVDRCDFFIHTWDINTPAPGVETAIVNTDYITSNFSQKVPLDDFDKLKEVYKPKEFKIDKFVYSDLVICPGFYISLDKALDMFDDSYDLIVVMRPDLLVDTTKNLETDLEFIDKFNFLFTDMHCDGNTRIDSALWVFKGSLKNTIHDCCKFLIANEVKLDDQVFLKDWLIDEGVSIKAVHNKNIWIYRTIHQSKSIPPNWLQAKAHDMKKQK